jgi:DNA-binding NtrC family response regulator
MNTTHEKKSILIVDDDKTTRDGLARALQTHYQVWMAESADRALNILGETDIDILLSDVRMPGMDGLTLLQRALAHKPELICILLTAYGNVETAVEAMKRGAYDFLMKPVNLDHLDLLLQRALRSRDVETENAQLREQLDKQYGLDDLLGQAPAMLHLFDTIKQAAPTQATVLIQGESGTGKELVAHAIHRLSTRAKGPFVAVHCAALAQNLLESELFGHEKGAFTGAAARRRGRFEMADGGTLFLDEISEIEPSLQVKLLRVLETRNFERVGGNETIEVDIRLIAATNRNLKALADAGKFREDLFFRLNVVDITLPPLRERADDIPLLSNRFIQEFSGRNNKGITHITPDAQAILQAYPWPGNVRELRNAIEKMVVLGQGPRLTARDIPQNIRTTVRGPDSHSRGEARGGVFLSPATSLADAEKNMIIAALKRHDDSRTHAAKELGISRRTLHRKLHEYAITTPKETDAAGTGEKSP